MCSPIQYQYIFLEDEDQFELDAKLNHVAKKTKLNELDLVSTAVLFMVAGSDTSATLQAFACYQLAKHPDIQDRLRLYPCVFP